MSTQDQGQANVPTIKEKPISDEHKLIAYWAAHGMDPAEIAKELEYSLPVVRKILKEKKVKLFVEKVRFKIYGEDPALHLKDCAKKAIVVAEDIMMNKKTKDHVRLLAAQDFMNREYGKAGIDDGMVEGTVRKILQMLQKPIEEKPKEDLAVEYTDVTPVTEKEAIKQVDEVEDWIDKNLK